jgi:molecular chaperone GrpE
MKSKSQSGNGRDQDTAGERLVDEVQADGATSAEAPPPDSYMTTDGSAATSTSNPGTETDPTVAEQREKYLRLAAEFENFRRRATKERQESGGRAQAELAKQLLDALDDLSRFAHLDPATTSPAAIVEGVQLVEKKMLKTLGAAGLQIVDPLGQQFDPAHHEAVSTEPAQSPEDDHIVSRVYQQGYVFNGQLLRPARVVVRQYNG